MAPFSFSSDRSFVVVSYASSHGPLLLRSRKRHDQDRRIDILFQDVRAIELRFWFDGIRIEEVELGQLKGLPSNPLALAEPGNRAYAVTGDGWSGYILAGIARTHEDNGGPLDPSALLGEN